MSVVIEMSAKEAALWRAQQRILDQQIKMEQKLRQVGQASREAGQQGQRAGEQAAKGWNVEPLKMFAATLSGVAGGLSVAGAFRTVLNLAREAREEIKGVAAELAQATDGMKFLWQVSEDVRDYEGLATRYKLAMASEGIGRQQAMDLVFQLRSLDQMDAIEAVAQSHRFMQADVAAKFLGTLRAPTAWGKDVATPEQAISGLSAGAQQSKFNVGETADWFVQAAPMAANLGASPWELLGVGAAVSSAFRQPAMTGTGMVRLITTLNKFREETRLAAEKGDRDAQAQWERLESARGIMDVFDIYRTVRASEFEMETEGVPRLKPSEQYELEKAGEVRFGHVAVALEGATEEARKQTAIIQRQAETQQRWRELTGARPPELTIQQQATVAKIQRELATEPLAEKQIQLQTALDRITAIVGGPSPITKGFEKAFETGATVGLVEQMIETANQRVVDQLEARYPEIATEHLGPVFPSRERRIVGWGGAGAMRYRQWEIPDEMLPEQHQAIQDALAAALAEQVTSRPAERRRAEERNRQAQEDRNVRRRIGMAVEGVDPAIIESEVPRLMNHPETDYGAQGQHRARPTRAPEDDQAAAGRPVRLDARDFDQNVGEFGRFVARLESALDRLGHREQGKLHRLGSYEDA